jgi:hypothetical protein
MGKRAEIYTTQGKFHRLVSLWGSRENVDGFKDGPIHEKTQ